MTDWRHATTELLWLDQPHADDVDPDRPVLAYLLDHNVAWRRAVMAERGMPPQRPR